MDANNDIKLFLEDNQNIFLLPVKFSFVSHADDTVRFSNCGALRDLVPFVQFKKREKHPWRSVNFNNLNKINTPP